jgi:hypothetical protein
MEIIYQGTLYTLKEELPTDRTFSVRLYNVAAKYYVEFERVSVVIGATPIMKLEPDITAKMPIGVYNLEIYNMQLGIDNAELQMYKHIENYAVVKETSMALAQN